MNRIILLSLLISATLTMQAQPPRGSGSRGTDGGNQQNRPHAGARQRNEPGKGAERLHLDSFPPIPAMTLEQRLNIGKALAKEQEDIYKWHQKKRELTQKDLQLPVGNGKDREKNQKERTKIDAAITKRIEKSNKKIQKILSEEQYRIFLEKRNDFRFNRTSRVGIRPSAGDGKLGEKREDRNREFRR